MATSIINVKILTMNNDLAIIDNGFVTYENDTITEIAEMRHYKNQSKNVINGQGNILMPGMVNTHTHMSMIPFRSLADDCKDRLRLFLFPLEQACMNEKLVYAATEYACCELLLSGVTTIFDMYYFEDEVAKAVDKMGIRAFLGETIINFQACDSDEAHGGLQYAEKFIPKWLNHPLITPCIAPHAPNTNSLDALIIANNISKKYKVPISMHLAEMTYELEYFKEKYNKTPVEFLESIGLLSDRLIAAHAIFLTDNDIKLLKKYNVKISHCIGANTKSAKGIAPIPKLLNEKVLVGLGSDGPSSGNTIDLFTQFKLFANFHKVTWQDRTLFPAVEIIKLGTIEGAKVLGIGDTVGSIEVGKKADLVMVETKSVNMFPLFDPYSLLVYSANASNVDTVIVNGEILVQKKGLTKANFTEIKNNLQVEMQDFQEQAKMQLLRN